MEVSISQFRRELFDLIGKAFSGELVWVNYKGRRFRIVAEVPADRLSRLTSMQILNPLVGEKEEQQLKDEMRRAWEEDWKVL